MAGYASRNRPYEGVGDPIADRIMKATGLNRSEIILSSSHTHTGPSQTTTSAASGSLGDNDARPLFDYSRWLQDRVVQIATNAIADLQPVTLSHGTGVASFVMNRREATPRGIVLEFNPRGPVDRSVPVLRVTKADGKPLAVLFQAGTHNTTLGGKHYAICGDYAGFAHTHVERELPGAQAMFMLGCAS